MCRYIRLNAFNVLHAPRPQFIAPKHWIITNDSTSSSRHNEEETMRSNLQEDALAIIKFMALNGLVPNPSKNIGYAIFYLFLIIFVVRKCVFNNFLGCSIFVATSVWAKGKQIYIYIFFFF